MIKLKLSTIPFSFVTNPFFIFKIVIPDTDIFLSEDSTPNRFPFLWVPSYFHSTVTICSASLEIKLLIVIFKSGKKS